MKNLKQTGLLFSIALVLVGCSRENQVKSFMPGTYVKSVRGEYSWASDTLVIADLGDNNYRITRHTAYQLIRNGKTLPKQHHTETLTGSFDEQRQVLMDLTKGRTFSFDADKGLLVVNGKGVYTKL
jgi:hypothetical protein